MSSGVGDFIDLNSIKFANIVITEIIKSALYERLGKRVDDFEFDSHDDVIGVRVVSMRNDFAGLYAPVFVRKPNVMRVPTEDFVIKTVTFTDLLVKYYSKFRGIFFGLKEGFNGKWEFGIDYFDNTVRFIIPYTGDYFVFRIKPGKHGDRSVITDASKIFLDSPFGAYYLFKLVTINKYRIYTDYDKITEFKNRLLMLINNVMRSNNLKTGFIGVTIRYDKKSDRYYIVNGYPCTINGFGECKKAGKSYVTEFI